MTSLIHLSPLLKCLMTVCPSSLHSCVQGTNFSPSEPPGEIMSFGVSPVNYSDSDSDEYPQFMFWIKNKKYIPCIPQFYYTQVGFIGVYITRFSDVILKLGSPM